MLMCDNPETMEKLEAFEDELFERYESEEP